MFSILLSSCGGYEKSNKLHCLTLNCTNEFHINIPVYQTHENIISFKFRNYYTIDDLKESLSKNGDYFAQYDDELFINTTVNNKSEYFLISINEPSEKSYFIESTSCVYLDSIGQSKNIYCFLISY